MVVPAATILLSAAVKAWPTGYDADCIHEVRPTYTSDFSTATLSILVSTFA